MSSLSVQVDDFRISRRGPVVAALLLAVGTWILFLQTRHFDFVNYDDPDYVAANIIVQEGISWRGISWAFTRAHSYNWHPVTWLSHMLDCEWFGVDPGAHHLVNAAFHAVNSALVFLVLAMATARPWRSWLVAAVFAAHPLHVESVAWICERKDVLSTFFGLLTLLCYVRYIRGGARPVRIRLYLFSLVFFALGLMSKPMLVTLPFVLLLLDFWPLQRVRGITGSSPAQERGATAQTMRALVLEKAPFFALTAAVSVTTFLVQRSQGAMVDAVSFPLPLRLANALVSCARYLAKTFWPEDLIVFYPYPEAYPVMQVIAAAALLLVVSTAAVLQMRVKPYLFVGWAWFLGTLVPVIGLVQVGTQAMADRYMYLPLIGLAVAVIWSAADFLQRRRFPMWAGVLAASGIVLALGMQSHRQIRHWRDSESLFQHVLRVSPGHVMAHVMLGNHYGGLGRLDDAIAHYEAALLGAPDFAEVHYNLANAYAGAARTEQAITHYETAIRLRPGYADAHANLAAVLGQEGRVDQALEHYEKALQWNPDDPALLRNLAVDLIAGGHYERAAEVLDRALRIEPGNPLLFLLNGDQLAGRGKIGAAAGEYQKALQLQPQLVEARQRLERLGAIREK